MPTRLLALASAVVAFCSKVEAASRRFYLVLAFAAIAFCSTVEAASRRFSLALTFFAVVAFCSTGVCDEPAKGKDDASFPIARENKTAVSVSQEKRPIMSYRHGDVPMKPYVERIFSPAGVQVLRDSPFDHKHHHALMFATAVDGVDVWAETPQNGKQKQRSVKAVNLVVLEPSGEATKKAGVSEQLEWVAPASVKPLLLEDREVFSLSATEKASDLGATLIEWRSSLQTPPGKDKPS